MEIFDITRPLGSRTAVWPGDEPFGLSWSARIADGEIVNLSWTRGSPHIGTHADAPLHVIEDAASIDRLPLDAFLGPARVVRVSPGPNGLIEPDSWDDPDETTPAGTRLLFRTDTDPDHGHANPTFAGFSPDSAHRLVARGARLVGIDTPSIDPADSSDLPVHRILLGGGVCVLENLDLRAVDPGDYELIALPLRIVGGDASPVRAILLRR